MFVRRRTAASSSASATACERRATCGRRQLRAADPTYREKSRRAVLGPHYISPATQAITISITGPTKVAKIAALTPNAGGCSRGLCTVTIPGLKPCPSSKNCYAAAIATYDAVTGCPSLCTIPPTAHELSGNQSVPFRIAKAQDNLIDVTLDGVPASAVLVPAADATLSGNMGSGFFLGKMQLAGAARQRVRSRCRR